MNSRPYYFMVTFWGPKYREFFYSLCLPTLLARNNLPVLKDRHGSKLLIATTEQDWKALRDRPMMKRLADYVEPFFIAIRHHDNKRPHDIMLHMSAAHRMCVRKAHDDKAIAGFISPDVLVSDGMIEKAVRLIESGKKVVLAPALRYSMEAVMRELGQAFGKEQPIALSAPVMSRRSSLWLHSELQRYNFESPCFHLHPHWVFWRIPGGAGIVLHTVSWAMLLGDYAVARYNDDFLETNTIDSHLVHEMFGHLPGKDMAFIDNTHDGLFMSLTSEFDLHYGQQEIFVNKFPVLGRMTKLAHIYRFYHSRALDPFLRKAYQVPVVMDAIRVNLRRDPIIRKAKDVMEAILHPSRLFLAFERIPRVVLFIRYKYNVALAVMRDPATIVETKTYRRLFRA